MTSRTRPGLRIAAGVLLGVLLAQAAWILAVPPFRGIDEFDHAYRAAGVAAGQWRLTEPARDGRGLLVDVPADMVEAAAPQCADLPYIEAHTCRGDRQNPDGTISVVTSAANYPPVFYVVVGLPGAPFDGAEALYGMRMMSAAVCAVLVALSALCVTTWAQGRWALTGLLAGVTPTLIYSTTLPAPNGAEMGAGLLLWTSLLGLAHPSVVHASRSTTARFLISCVALSSALLVSLRTLGPLWILMILACVVVARGWRGLLDVGLRHRGLVAGGLGLVLAAGLGAYLWNGSTHPVEPGALNAGINTQWTQVFRYPRWVLGSIGAFPFKDQPAPVVVHLLILAVMVTGLVVAIRSSRGPARRSVLLAAAMCLVVPSLLVAVTLEDRGGQWQGRYVLPFAVGVMVLVGAQLDASGWRSDRTDRRPQLLAIAMIAIGHVISVVHVQLAETGREISAQDPGWVHPSAMVTGLVMVAAWAALGATALLWRGPALRDPAASAASLSGESSPS